MRTLWDLLPKKRQIAVEPAASPRHSTRRSGPAQARYERMTRAMLERYRIRVRKWRSSTSGVAWQVTYADGSVSRLIESPRPRGPMSAAVFLHEIGHHAIGFNVYAPRCLEEYHAWRFSIAEMRAWEIAVTQRVQERLHDSLHYTLAKALRRGLKRVPIELLPYREPRRDAGTAALIEVPAAAAASA